MSSVRHAHQPLGLQDGRIAANNFPSPPSIEVVAKDVRGTVAVHLGPLASFDDQVVSNCATRSSNDTDTALLALPGSDLRTSYSMPPASSPPAVLIIPGAFGTPEVWQPFLERLRAIGTAAHCCSMFPTMLGEEQAPDQRGTLYDDAAVASDAIKSLMHEGHPIVILAHSWGGLVAAESITPDLYAPTPSSPGVVSIIHLCAFLAPAATNQLQIFQEHGWLSGLRPKDLETSNGLLYMENLDEVLYNDVEDKKLRRQLSGYEKPQTQVAASNAPHHEPWRDIPCQYVVSKLDRSIFPDLQRAMLKSVVDRGGRFEVLEWDCGHMPMISQPDAVLQLLKRTIDGL